MTSPTDHLRGLRTSELILLKGVAGELTVKRIEAILLGRIEDIPPQLRTTSGPALYPTLTGDTITLNLDEPPSVNRMIEMAKRGGRGMVYYKEKKKYEKRCLELAALQGFPPPPEPWQLWSLQHLHYRTWNEWDWVELAAGAKWVVDALVKGGYILDDSPREMLRPEVWPTQEILRSNRGVTIIIRREP